MGSRPHFGLAASLGKGRIRCQITHECGLCLLSETAPFFRMIHFLLPPILYVSPVPAIMQWVIPMVYACDSCHFIFKRYSQTEQCPDCGKYDVRPATALEQEEFERRLKAQVGSPTTDPLPSGRKR